MRAQTLDLDRVRKFQALIDRETSARVNGWSDIPSTDPLKIVSEIVASVSSTLDKKIDDLPREIAEQLPGIFGISDAKAEASRAVLSINLASSALEEFILPSNTEFVVQSDQKEIIFRSEESIALFPTLEPIVMQDKDEVFVGFDSIPESAHLNLYFELERGIKVSNISWYAARKGAWLPLSVVDYTKNFATSGIVKIFISNVLTEKSEFKGQEYYWIKVKVDSPETHLPLRSVKLNIVPVSNLMTHAELCIGSGNGLKNQSIALPAGELLKPFRLKIFNSERGSYEYWAEVQSFFLSSAESKHWKYNLEKHEISFGDGVQGSCVPPGFDNIWVEDLSLCDGANANFARTTKVSIKSEDYRIQDIRFCDDIHSGVSVNRKSNLVEKMQSLLAHRERAVTINDYRELARSASGRIGEVYIRQANRFDINIIPLLHEDYARNRHTLDFKPYPSDLIVLEEYLNDRRSLNTRLKIEAPSYRDITIHAQVFVRRINQDIRNEIESLLRGVFSPYGNDRENIFPGMRLSRDAILRTLESSPLVISIRDLQLEDQENGLNHISISLEPNELPRVYINLHLMEGGL